MRCSIGMIVMVGMLASSAFGQQVARTIDPAVLPWGPFVDVRPVNADGDAATEEWLVYRRQTAEFHVVAVNPTGVCLGAPFTVSGVYPYAETPELVTWQGRDVLKVKRPTTLFSYVFEFITLLRPVC